MVLVLIVRDGGVTTFFWGSNRKPCLLVRKKFYPVSLDVLLHVVPLNKSPGKSVIVWIFMYLWTNNSIYNIYNISIYWLVYWVAKFYFFFRVLSCCLTSRSRDTCAACLHCGSSCACTDCSGPPASSRTPRTWRWACRWLRSPQFYFCKCLNSSPRWGWDYLMPPMGCLSVSLLVSRRAAWHRDDLSLTNGFNLGRKHDSGKEKREFTEWGNWF